MTRGQQEQQLERTEAQLRWAIKNNGDQELLDMLRSERKRLVAITRKGIPVMPRSNSASPPSTAIKSGCPPRGGRRQVRCREILRLYDSAEFPLARRERRNFDGP